MTPVRCAAVVADAQDAQPPSHESGAGSKSRKFWSRTGWRSVELLTLVALAVAQPLLSLFGSNATYLAAHELIGTDLVWFALAIVAVPTLILVGIDAVAELVSPRAAPYVHAILLGFLVGLLIGPPLNRMLGIAGVASVLVLVLLMVGAAVLFARTDVPRRIVRYGAFAPVVVLLLFLVASPASQLLNDSVAVSQLTSTPKDAPVVWVVFDQFPLSFLVDDQGQILEERYPNFARLAEVSTWYPNTSSIATETSFSVPASLSGRYPTGALPVASEYPENLFTLLAPSHEIQADEYVTQLCPDSVCSAGERSSGRQWLWSDTRAVFVRSVLAPDVADRFVPRVDDRWSGFGNEAPVVDSAAGDAITAEDIQNTRLNKDDDRVRFQTFLDGFESDELPTVHYIHMFQPHEPLRFLPTGQQIDTPRSFVSVDGRWPDNQLMMDQRLQRYVLQALNVDRQVGLMLDRLEETQLLDDAVIVVMSDHGVSFRPDTLNRKFADDTIDDLLPVPLFIKRPGQSDGEVDRRLAQQTDILPTVLDMLGVDTRTIEFDGVSLVGPDDPERVPVIFNSGRTAPLDTAPDVLRSPTIAWISSLLTDETDPYAFGPDARLSGQDAAPLINGNSDISVTLPTKRRFDDVEPESPYLPANIFGTLSGTSEPTRIAVAVNGVIAGEGSSFYNDGWQVTVVVDPSSFVAGKNDVQMFAVEPDGLASITIE